MSLAAAAYRHMKSPHGYGPMEGADLVGRAGEAHQGPFAEIFLRLNDGRIEEARFTTFSCPWSIAAGSALAKRLEGLSLSEAAVLNEQDIEAELGGVPRHKRYCLSLVLAALRDALAAKGA